MCGHVEKLSFKRKLCLPCDNLQGDILGTAYGFLEEKDDVHTTDISLSCKSFCLAHKKNLVKSTVAEQ